MDIIILLSLFEKHIDIEHKMILVVFHWVVVLINFDLNGHCLMSFLFGVLLEPQKILISTPK